MAAGADIPWATLMALTGNRMGVLNVPCPLCSAQRKPANRKKPVLRVWRDQRLDFCSFNCAHCDAHGYAHSDSPWAQRIDPKQLALMMREADKAKVERDNRMRRTAKYLWGGGMPIRGTVGERYLREARGITCALPATLRFLPASGSHAAAMIAPFGIPAEPEPGRLDVERLMIHGIHLTRLKPDGSGKADVEGEPDKIFIGSAPGLPLVLAPANDLGGLGIAEGIEDALSLHQTTGLGAWAAGAANRLPALARAVPRYVECVNILVDDNEPGRKHSYELARQLRKVRGSRFDVRLLENWLLSQRAAA
jgi:hypothetical protein